MNSSQPLETFLELRRESVIGFDLGGKEGVSADVWLVKNEEERSARRLLLVGLCSYLLSVKPSGRVKGSDLQRRSASLSWSLGSHPSIL